MEIQIKTQIDTEVLNREVVITNQDEYTQAGDVLKLCKKKIKSLEDERKTYTQPLDESKKLIMAKFNKTINPIKDYIDKINKSMGAWYLEEEKKRAEEQKRLEEEAIKNATTEETDIVVPVVESVKTVRGNIAINTAKKYYEFEIVDETKIPREYLMVDESKIKKAINSDVDKIDGIKIIETVRFTSR